MYSMRVVGYYMEKEIIMKKQTALLLSTMVLMTAVTVQPAHAFKFWHKKEAPAVVAPVKTEVKAVETAVKQEVKKVDTVVKQDVKKVETKVEAKKPVAKAPVKPVVKPVAAPAVKAPVKAPVKPVAAPAVKVAPKAPVKK